jgi:hypothetical protein
MAEQHCVGENRILSFSACNNLGADTPCLEKATICSTIATIEKPISGPHGQHSVRFENSNIAKSAMIENHLLNLGHFEGTYPESSLGTEYEGIGPWDISAQVRLLRHLPFKVICLCDGFAINGSYVVNIGGQVPQVVGCVQTEGPKDILSHVDIEAHPTQLLY